MRNDKVIVVTDKLGNNLNIQNPLERNKIAVVLYTVKSERYVQLVDESVKMVNVLQAIKNYNGYDIEVIGI